MDTFCGLGAAESLDLHLDLSAKPSDPSDSALHASDAADWAPVNRSAGPSAAHTALVAALNAPSRRSDDVEGRLRDLLGDVDDLELRSTVERVLRPHLLSEVAMAKERRRVFRKELRLAEEAGFADPVEVASNRTRWAAMKRAYDKRLSAIFGRAESRSIQRDDRVARRREAAAKSARPGLRRLPQRDRGYVCLLGRAERDGHPIHGSLVASELLRKLKGYAPPHWDRTTTALKVLAYAIESHRRGAITFNLRLGHEVAEKALASTRGPAGFLQNRIREALKLEFGDDAPDFWFTIEGGGRGSVLHAHGAVVVPCNPELHERVEKALRHAGGRWASPKGQHHQLRMTELVMAFGWAGYVCKELNITGRDIDRRLVGVTVGLARAARKGWSDLRASLPRA